MGFATTVAGYIIIEDDSGQVARALELLPSLSADEWPFLPREAFAPSPATGLLAYKGRAVIHFGFSVKEVEGEWSEWLDKFERFFKAAGATEAFVTLSVPYANSGEGDGRFSYSWRLRWQPSGSREWEFIGGERAPFGG
jgi:hypothetical protein